MAFIDTLRLTNFRNYDRAAISGLSSGPVVLYGANGAGKTNILEALSFLTSGRGLRKARPGDVQKQDSDAATAPWAVSALVHTPLGETRIGSGLDPQRDKRIFRVNGEPPSKQTDLEEYLACVWLTPQMDRLFLDAPGSRRRFLDRLIFAFDPRHSGRTRRYENALRQRSKLLQENDTPDPSWLTGLETTMAETGVALAATRRDFVARLQAVCDDSNPTQDSLFPRAVLRVAGTVETLLGQAPALEVEDSFRYQLEQSRPDDARTGGAATGPHKSDLAVTYAARNMPAGDCSTGEQKALLIGIILAHSRLLAGERGDLPLLLLDEIAAHLDERRRGALFEQLIETGQQVWLTGTDRSLFEAIESKARFFHVAQGKVCDVLQDAA